MLVPIKRRFTGTVLFEAEVDASLSTKAERLGAAAKLALKAGADLARADLSDADLTNTDLRGADLTGTNLAHVYFAVDAGSPNGWRCVGWLKGGVIQVRAGCRDKTLAEGRAYWAGREDRREVLAALDYIETVATLRRWPVAAPAERAV